MAKRVNQRSLAWCLGALGRAGAVHEAWGRHRCAEPCAGGGAGGTDQRRGMSGKVLDLEAESGRGRSAITLEDVQATAIAHGFAKPNADSRKPLRCRADLHAFFAAYGVKAFTPFKQLFETRRLLPPGEGGFADSGASSETSDPDSATTVEPMPIERYEELSSSFDRLKWRLHARPGGATTRPDDFYRLTGAHTAFEREAILAFSAAR